MVREIAHIEGVYLLSATRTGRTTLYYIGEAGDIGGRFCTHRRSARSWAGRGALSKAERQIAPSQYKLRLVVLRELEDSSASQRHKHELLFKAAAARVGLPITNQNQAMGRDLADTDLGSEIAVLEEALGILRGTDAT